MNQISAQKGAETVLPGAGLLHLINQLHTLSTQQFSNEKIKQLLASVGAIRRELEPYIFYEQDYYTRNRIYKTSAFELILMCWQPGQHSAVHGHEGQKCWMYVAEGSLEFTNYQDVPGEADAFLKKISTQTGTQGFVDGPAYIHGVASIGTEPAISLHLYANPFSQCDAYDVCAQTTKKIQLCYYSIDGKRVK